MAVCTGTQWCEPHKTVADYTSISRDSTLRLQVRGRGGGHGRDLTGEQRTFVAGLLLMGQGMAQGTRSSTGEIGAGFLKKWAQQQQAKGGHAHSAHLVAWLAEGRVDHI